MSKKEYTGVNLPVAILTFAAVAAVMAVGLAVLKLNTMVTFILIPCIRMMTAPIFPVVFPSICVMMPVQLTVSI